MVCVLLYMVPFRCVHFATRGHLSQNNTCISNENEMGDVRNSSISPEENPDSSNIAHGTDEDDFH